MSTIGSGGVLKPVILLTNVLICAMVVPIMKRRLFRLFGIRSVALLLAADVVLSFAYASLPTTSLAARSAISMVQLVTMGLTMGVAFKWLLKDF